MLHFIYGRTSSGKSDWLYAKASESAKSRRVFIIVPDREAVAAERKCAELEGGENIDVVTFSRLVNYIFRKKGGICQSYIGAGAKKIIMYGVLRDIKAELDCFGKISPSDLSTVEKLTGERSEFYKNMITPEQLAEAAEDISETPKTRAKLCDLAKIFAAYDGEIAKRWSEPDGAISKACEVCGDFFDGSDVFIDSFISFTKQQYGMLSLIFSRACDTYITLGYVPADDRDSTAFVSLAKTDAILHAVAKEAGTEIAKPLEFSRRLGYKNKSIEYLADRLFLLRKSDGETDVYGDGVFIVECRNRHEEAEAVATDIAKRVRKGYRYRDMAVIARDTESYAGIIDSELEKADIPYYVSHRTDIDERGIVKFIYSAYACIGRGFRLGDIIEYIKTDYAGISGDECDMLENYLIKWKLQGKKFTSDETWTAPLRGYDDRIRDGDEEALETLNALRETVRKPLLAFAGLIGNCTTVKDHATALYDFLMSMEIPSKLKGDAALAAKVGDAKGAEEFAQLWRALMDALDQTVGSAGEKNTDAEGFLRLLKLAFSETDIGSIPTSVDEVVIGGAANTHPKVKIVYILGATDGVFPKRISEEGIISEFEKDLLRKRGIEFSSTLEKSISDENYYFYQAVCAPSEILFITYAPVGKTDGSAALRQVKKLLPKASKLKFDDVPKTDRIYSAEAALEYVLTERDGASRAMAKYLSSKPEYSERLAYAKESVSAGECRISGDAAEEIFGEKTKTSYSRLENYIKCHFKYFCDYELRISDEGSADFSAVNIGNFMHAALEAAARYACDPDCPEEKIEKSVRLSAESYIRSVTGRPLGELSPRLRHITDHLCEKAKLFAQRIRREFSESKFRPVRFEFPIGEGCDVGALRIDDGKSAISLFGRVDRIDTYDNPDDGNLYLRVIDYKTGSKVFDFGKVSKGLDMQMLLYLFSLCENGEKCFGKKPVPAGVLYVNLDTDSEKIKLDAEREKKKSVSGFVTAMGDDRLDLARAMEPDLKGEFLPFGTTSRKYAEKPMGLDAIEELKESVVQTVLDCAAEMKNGAAQAAPVDCKGVDPCKYCRMKPICRIIKTKGNEEEEDENS